MGKSKGGGAGGGEEVEEEEEEEEEEEAEEKEEEEEEEDSSYDEVSTTLLSLVPPPRYSRSLSRFFLVSPFILLLLSLSLPLFFSYSSLVFNTIYIRKQCPWSWRE